MSKKIVLYMGLGIGGNQRLYGGTWPPIKFMLKMLALP